MTVKAVTTTLALTAAAALAAGARLHAAGQSLPLKLVANVTLPGPSNRFDYASLGPQLRIMAPAS